MFKVADFGDIALCSNERRVVLFTYDITIHFRNG